MEDFAYDNILIEEKSFANILLYVILCKNLIASKRLHNRFNKIDGFIIVYDKIRYLVLFGSKKYDSIYHKIRYLISVKRGITYVISHNYAKIKVNSYDSLSVEKTVTFHNVIILSKSFWNKNKNIYHYNIFSGKS